MKLHIEFDEERMLSYAQRGSPPVFTIYWMSGQASFPEEGWIDFGSVILGWWLVAAKQLVTGAQEGELLFMDGPFRLKVRSVGNKLTFSATDLDQPWQVTQASFVTELLAGAKRVQKKLQELGIADKEGLKIGVTQLDNAVAEQLTRKRVSVVEKQYAA